MTLTRNHDLPMIQQGSVEEAARRQLTGDWCRTHRLSSYKVGTGLLFIDGFKCDIDIN